MFTLLILRAVITFCKEAFAFITSATASKDRQTLQQTCFVIRHYPISLKIDFNTNCQNPEPLFF
jgi:hypothetical protein